MVEVCGTNMWKLYGDKNTDFSPQNKERPLTEVATGSGEWCSLKVIGHAENRQFAWPDERENILT